MLKAGINQRVGALLLVALVQYVDHRLALGAGADVGVAGGGLADAGELVIDGGAVEDVDAPLVNVSMDEARSYGPDMTTA